MLIKLSKVTISVHGHPQRANISDPQPIWLNSDNIGYIEINKPINGRSSSRIYLTSGNSKCKVDVLQDPGSIDDIIIQARARHSKTAKN
jgi:hypothetical protein